MPDTAPNKLLGPDGDDIIAIAYFRKGRSWIPHEVRTEHRSYDFDYSRTRQRLYWHCCGGGGLADKFHCHGFAKIGRLENCRLWLDPRCKPVDSKGKDLTPDELRKLGYKRIDCPDSNPFDDAEESKGGTEWCNICRDRFDEDDMCRHVHYEEGVGYSLGCGSSDVDLEQTRLSLFRLLQLLPDDALQTLKKALASGKYHVSTMDSILGGSFTVYITSPHLRLSLEPLGYEERYEERYWPGIAWLLSLDPKGPATSLTVGWLWQFEHEQYHSRCVLSLKTVYAQVTKRQLTRWKTCDPWFLSDEVFAYKPPAKADSANAAQFLKAPRETEALHMQCGERSLRLSVAFVQVGANKSTWNLTFGRILEVDGQRVYEPTICN